VTLQRLITFKPEVLAVHALYRAQGAPNNEGGFGD
jgi:hypothetical protein